MLDLDRVNAYLSRVEESETNTFPPVSGKLKVGVDLGTAYIVLVVLDEENNPVACEKRASGVLRDGVVVDYTGALRIGRELKEKLEARLGAELVNCAIAMPAGTESSARTHQYVAEGAGLEVTAVLDLLKYKHGLQIILSGSMKFHRQLLSPLSKTPASRTLSDIDKILIDTGLFQKFLMGSLLCNLAVVYN